MRFAPTPTNGRVLEGDTPFGRFHVEWDAAGQLVRESLELREPATPDSAGPPSEPRPRPTLAMMRDWTIAALGGSYVDVATQREREATCATCDHVKTDAAGPWCGVCGCGVGGDIMRVRNLAAYAEKLDPNTTVEITAYGKEIGRGVTWGCKHPQRAQGKGWRR